MGRRPGSSRGDWGGVEGRFLSLKLHRKECAGRLLCPPTVWAALWLSVCEIEFTKMESSQNMWLLSVKAHPKEMWCCLVLLLL